MSRDGRRLVGSGDHEREEAGRGAGLHLGQERQAVRDPGIDQHDVGALGGKRSRGAFVAVAQGKRAAEVA
jgi:hypothetical protein